MNAEVVLEMSNGTDEELTVIQSRTDGMETPGRGSKGTIAVDMDDVLWCVIRVHNFRAGLMGVLDSPPNGAKFHGSGAIPRCRSDVWLVTCATEASELKDRDVHDIEADHSQTNLTIVNSTSIAHYRRCLQSHTDRSG